MSSPGVSFFRELRQGGWRRLFASNLLRTGGSYLVLGNALELVLGLINQYLLTRLLAVEDYGCLAWIGTIVGTLGGVLAFSGLSNSVVSAIAQGKGGNFRVALRYKLLGGAIAGVVLGAFAGYYWVIAQQKAVAILFCSACVLGPLLWLDLPEQFWTGKGEFRTIFWYTFGLKCFGTVALAYSLYLGAGITACFLAQTAIIVLSNLVVTVLLLRSGDLNTEESRELTKYGFLTWRLQLIGGLLSRIDRYVVVALFGLRVLALFAVGEMVLTVFLKLPNSMLSQLYQAQLARMPLQQAARWLLARQSLFFLCYGTACAAMAAALPWLFPLLFSQAYDESIQYAYWFLGMAVAAVPSVLTGTVLKSHACTWETKFMSAVIYGLAILVLPLAWLSGITGLLCGRVVAAAVTGVCCYWVLVRLSKDDAQAAPTSVAPGCS